MTELDGNLQGQLVLPISVFSLPTLSPAPLGLRITGLSFPCQLPYLGDKKSGGERICGLQAARQPYLPPPVTKACVDVQKKRSPFKDHPACPCRAVPPGQSGGGAGPGAGPIIRAVPLSPWGTCPREGRFHPAPAGSGEPHMGLLAEAQVE